LKLLGEGVEGRNSVPAVPVMKSCVRKEGLIQQGVHPDDFCKAMMKQRKELGDLKDCRQCQSNIDNGGKLNICALWGGAIACVGKRGTCSDTTSTTKEKCIARLDPEHIRFVGMGGVTNITTETKCKEEVFKKYGKWGKAGNFAVKGCFQKMRYNNEQNAYTIGDDHYFGYNVDGNGKRDNTNKSGMFGAIKHKWTSNTEIDETKCFCTKDPIKCNDENASYSGPWVGKDTVKTLANKYPQEIRDTGDDTDDVPKGYCNDRDNSATRGTLSRYSKMQKYRFLKTGDETHYMTRDSLVCDENHVKTCHIEKGCFCSKTKENCNDNDWKNDDDDHYYPYQKWSNGRPEKSRSLLIKITNGRNERVTIQCENTLDNTSVDITLQPYTDKNRLAFQRPWYQHSYPATCSDPDITTEAECSQPNVWAPLPTSPNINCDEEYKIKRGIWRPTEIAVCQPVCETPERCTEEEIRDQCEGIAVSLNTQTF